MLQILQLSLKLGKRRSNVVRVLRVRFRQRLHRCEIRGVGGGELGECVVPCLLLAATLGSGHAEAERPCLLIYLHSHSVGFVEVMLEVKPRAVGLRLPGDVRLAVGSCAVDAEERRVHLVFFADGRLGKLGELRGLIDPSGELGDAVLW